MKRVNFHVENTRVGQVTNYDRLVIEVWTDGTTPPDEAVDERLRVQHEARQHAEERAGDGPANGGAARLDPRLLGRATRQPERQQDVLLGCQHR